MSVERLTDARLRGLRPRDAGLELRDEVVSGLCARVDAGGGVTFSLVYRLGGRGSTRRRLRLGRYPKPLSLSQAREVAAEHLRTLARGVDPATGRREQQAARPSLADLVAAFFAAQEPTPWRAEQARVLSVDVLPALGRRPADELRRGEIVALLDQVKRRAPASANRSRKILRQVYRWALERELVAADPTLGVRAPAAEVSRDRVLGADEIRRLWPALDEYPGPLSIVLALELVTAQRGGEVLRMRRAAIAGEWWTIPKAETKSRREDHAVFLSPTALRLVALAPGKDLLFPGPGGAPMIPSAPARAMRRVCERAGIADATPHDLRRTAATLMAEAGVDEHVISIVLGHQTRPGARVTRIYNRHRYAAEKRAAALALERRLLEILGGQPVEPGRDLGREPAHAAR